MSKRFLALIGATFVALIYGATFIFAKDVMPAYVKPYGFILIRAIGGAFLFWLLTFLVQKKKLL